MEIFWAILGLVLQQEKPCDNETCWIIFVKYVSESTDINWTGQFDFSPWLHLKNGAYFVVFLILAFNWLPISAIGKTVLVYCLLRT